MFVSIMRTQVRQFLSNVMHLALECFSKLMIRQKKMALLTNDQQTKLNACLKSLKKFKYTKNSLFLGVSFIQQTSGKKFYLADPAEQWDAINGVGLRNHFLCTAYASRMMVERKNGLIVNVSSPGGLRLVKI